MQTYLFYDIETTGLNKAFDQVLQFAAIRTDQKLKELKRYELKVKLNADIIPSPKAVITHHIGIKEAQEGLSEIEAIKQIHALLNEPGTISLGYNTLGFDDEFLRFSFYRNLLTPYTHQFANQCGRMDIFPMTVMYYLFKNHVLTWPIKKDGKISLKLEELNQANQLAHGRAHDAMADVEATVALALRFLNEREMWDYLVGNYNKKIDETRSFLPDKTDALMVYSKFGSDSNFLCPVLLLGQHRTYKNQTIWLRLDSEKLTTTSIDNIKETTWAIRKKPAEPGFILPRKKHYLEQIKPDVLALSETNKKWLLENPNLFEKIRDHYLNETYPVHPQTDIEARLYLNGFWTPEEMSFCRQFHAAKPKEKALLTEKLNNKNFKTLATRLLGKHYSEILTTSQKEHFTDYLKQSNPKDEAQALIDFRGEKRLTAKAALTEIGELRKVTELSEKQLSLLDELEEYLLKVDSQKH